MVAPQKEKILYVFILLQTLPWEWAHGSLWDFLCSKSGSTEPTVTRLALQEVALINSFLSIEIRIMSQQHYPSFTIPSRYILHINLWTEKIYFGLYQWLTRSGRSPAFRFSREILTFPNLLWCESEWKQNSLCKMKFRTKRKKIISKGQNIWLKKSGNVWIQLCHIA